MKDIRECIIDWADKHFNNFSFREHQLDTIVKIIERVLDYKEIKNQIIEAPTGSGKSIICLIAAGVLADVYNKKSYILVSNLYLWKQYVDFIEKQNLEFGYLKGLTGNYLCKKNHEDMRNSECKIARIQYHVLFNSKKARDCGFSCADNCEYIQARKKAIASSVTLMTYQLYHYQLNVVKTKTFEPRDVIFCDECHNIPDIMQSNCSPCIQKSDFEHYSRIYDWAHWKTVGLFSDEKIFFALKDKFPKKKSFTDALDNLYEEMCKENTSEKDWELISSYTNVMSMISQVCESIEDDMENKFKNNETIDIKLYKSVSYARNHFCIIDDFYDATEALNAKEKNGPYFVKNVNDTGIGKAISYSCVKEDFLTWRYLLRHAKNRIMLSATVGLKEAFDDNIGIKYTEQKESTMDRIPSTFDFSKSPILVSEKYKMTYREKETSFPKLKEITYKILEKHKNEKGIIQTGNYENAKRLYNEAPKELKRRLLLYENSKEKEIFIKQHLDKENSVLIGPSLNEGIDLPGELCRFIIIFKIPYPQLKDKLVQAKMRLFPEWYKSKTSSFVIQGIGRGNRSKEDWCMTYIIDGCFVDLFKSTRKQYSTELQQRMKFFK